MENVNDLTMRYFIDNIKTYASVNKKGRALQIYVQQFDRHLIADECSLDALKCDIEHQIRVMNEKYPRSRLVRLEVYENAKGGLFLWSMTATALSASYPMKR